MSDGDSVGGVLKDLAKETVKQVANVPKGLALSATSQIINQDSEEKEAEKKAQKAMTFQRIKEIEAEIARIRSQNERKTGPEVISQKEASEVASDAKKPKKPDEASRQAIGRAEQGRNYKG